MFYLNLLENPRQPRSNFWAVWLFVLGAVMACWIFSGCITREKCNERFPTKDSIYTVEKIVCVADTIYTAGETADIESEIPCPDYHATQTNGHIRATIDIKAGHLSVTCREDSLMRVIENERKTITTYQSKKAETITVIQWKTAWYYTVACWWVVVSLCLTVLLLLYLYFKSLV